MTAPIRTSGEFATAISELLKEVGSASTRSLEEYLRALLGKLEQERECRPTYELFVALLRDAFRDNAVAYDVSWSAVTRPPSNPWLVPPDLPQFRLKTDRTKLASLRENMSDFECLLGTLRFQIADLHGMTSKELQYRWRYMGLKSPRGNDWYNWDPFVYLERGTAGFLFHLERHYLVGSDELRCNWAALAHLLEMGRLWE